MLAYEGMHCFDASPIRISRQPLVQKIAGTFGRDIHGPVSELRLGLSLEAVQSEYYPPAIGGLLLEHAKLSIAFQLIAEGLQLCFDHFGGNLIG
jgi:hypothetical protein